MNDVLNAFAQGHDSAGLIRIGELKAALRDLQNEIYHVTCKPQ